MIPKEFVGARQNLFVYPSGKLELALKWLTNEERNRMMLLTDTLCSLSLSVCVPRIYLRN